ncbi:hypothetical protein G3T36_01290 [Diaminobutyricibacter tongyongensis]|uniref:Uncharacterized protein n=1 Tax=Leifsonia tongyongensis TaxID=1268043 RepID=A0A6L9XT59_9MICO|nr:hypothetical protein [Diaminobutyricibacter tongyongensis]NEN04496.1 hypothetical protein [Diaminobutyricibacter tongyongensis]
MSNTTPESPNAAEPEGGDIAAAERNGSDADIANPPSEPVPARGHVNVPESEAAGSVPGAEPASAEAAPPASASAPVSEPEPAAAASDEDVRAAVARSTADTADTADTGNVGDENVVADENVEHYDTAATAAYTTAPAAAAPVVGGAAVAGATTAAPYGQAGQTVTPIYVQAPHPPRKKSNRGFGILIALAGTVVFALVYAAVVAVIAAIGYPAARFFDEFVKSFLGVWVFWIPVIFFFIAMVILVQILNRAGWWAYIIGGFVVAAVVYFSYAGGVLLQVQAWAHTPQEVGRLLNVIWLTAPAIWAGVVAREVSIWTGLWLAVRGRRLRVKNAEAQAEYDRAIAAGPRGTQNGYAPGA